MVGKTQIADRLAERLGGRAAAGEALAGVLDVIGAALAAGERVTLTGFGTFDVVERPARVGRNPQTRQPVDIPATTAVRFHPGAGLRAAVAAGEAPAAATVARSVAPRVRGGAAPAAVTAVAPAGKKSAGAAGSPGGKALPAASTAAAGKASKKKSATPAKDTKKASTTKAAPKKKADKGSDKSSGKKSAKKSGKK